MRKICFLFFLIPFFGFANSDQQIKNRMKSDIDFMYSTLDVYYAPKEWKKTYSGWDLDEEIIKAKQKIDSTSNITKKDYHTIVKEFFQTMKDYHADVLFHSTERATLPFSIKGVRELGKYYISYVNDDELPFFFFPFKVGDELVSFNGRSPSELVEELVQKETRHANPEADHSFASHYLTHRNGRLGHTVPSGSVSIEIKPKNSKQTMKYDLKWNYHPEKITDGHQLDQKRQLNRIGKQEDLMDTSLALKLPKKKMESLLSEVFKPNKISYEKTEAFLGSRKSFIPPLSNTILWETNDENFFHAYLYKAANGKKIGYIRIPDFSKENEEFEKLAEIIAYFQNHSQALVIDQVDNPGGNDEFLINTLSVLSNKPLDLPKEKMMITPKDIEGAVKRLEILESLQENLGYLSFIDEEEFITLWDYNNFIVSEWNAGRNFTNPYYMAGVSTVTPSKSKVVYTKPILVLINGLDMSAGDFFPAILQDNHRATLLGTRTAGAGGYILNTTFPNRFGIKTISYTASIAERADKNPIENLGVTPDIEYKLTEDDYQNNYQGYVNAINNAVINLK
jgi:Peptidase family S41/PDZ domain